MSDVPTDTTKRKYQTMWEQLRDYGYLQVNAPRSAHKTILQAVRKESNKDTVFRFKCVERGRSYVIAYNQVGDIIYMRLEWKDKVRKKFISSRKGKSGNLGDKL